MRVLTLALVAMPTLLWAAGDDDDSPPAATQTTTTCATGLVWSEAEKKCVAPQDSSLNDDMRYQAVRELAYAGRLSEAQAVLATMSDQNEGRVLTYWGFTHGKMGNLETGLTYYLAALSQDPDNILARSYMGQALVAAGNTYEARVQLAEIANRDGAGTWAETSLRNALATGQGYSH